MNRDRLLSLAVLLAVIITIGFNAFNDSLPVAELTVSDVSFKYPTLVTPAGYAFAIWGLIFTALLTFAIYQALPAHRDEERLRSIRPYVILNCAANCGWLLVWRNELLLLSLVAMLTLLATLIVIYSRLQTSAGSSTPLIEKLCVELPFSIYFGWITVAMIVNVAVVLVAAGWGSLIFSATFWAVVLLVIGLMIVGTVYVNFRESVYALVFVWASLAIAAANNDASPVLWTAVATAIGAVTMIIFGRVQGRRVLRLAQN